MKTKTVLTGAVLTITFLVKVQGGTAGSAGSIPKAPDGTNSPRALTEAPKIALPEIFVVVNSSGSGEGAGTAAVLKACRTLVNGDAQRILEVARAWEEQFGGPLKIEETIGEDATRKARWLRGWLSQRVHPGGTLVLVGDQRSLPTWHVRLGPMNCTTDSFYADLDDDGIPETAVCRILGTPDLMVRQIEGKKDYGRKAAILCSEDTRIHLETRAFARQLSRLGYAVDICGVRSDAALAGSDVIVHFGHGSPAGISNRFGETFVSAGTVPALTRSPIVFVDGCGTLPVGSPLLRAFLEQGAVAYVGSTETVQGMIPARFTNEIVEHFLRIMERQPDCPLAHVLVAARAAYVQGHPGLAEKLRVLAGAGMVDTGGEEAIDLLTVTEWVYYGDPRAILPGEGKPGELCREALGLSEPVRLDEGNRSWRCSFVGQPEDGQAVLALYADIPLSEAASFRLSVRQNQKRIADLDSHNDTRYQNLGQDCRGGYASGATYRARFLVPVDGSAGKQDLEVRLESGFSVCLTPGTAIDVWPADFEKRIGLKHAPDFATLRQARRPEGQKPVRAVGEAKLHPADRSGFLSVDLSSLFNRPHQLVQVGGGDNASFKTWFPDEGVSADGIPFRVRRDGNDVLVSGNNTQNVFEIKGFERSARRLHFLLWGYNNPRQPASLEIGFKDGSSQAFNVPLSEWTRGEPPVAFDFENTIPVFRHAAIAHQTVEVDSPNKEIVRISSASGTYGLIAVTFEE
jgi:hypothetical protein